MATKFEDTVRKYTPRMMKDLSITEVQACGIWGNVGTETGGLVHMQELKPLVQGSKGGYGWMQWTGPRRRKYEAWCLATKRMPSDDESNYLYLVQETKTDEVASLVALRKTTTVKAATETFCKRNLRPGIVHLDSRLKWAQKATDALKPKTGGAVAAVAVVAVGGVAAAAAGEYAPTNYLPYIFSGLGLAGASGLLYMLFRKNTNVTNIN